MNAIIPHRQTGKAGIPIPPDVLARIARDYEAGAKRQDLRDRYKVGNSTITRALHECGIAQRAVRVIHGEESEQKVVALYKAGVERKDIVARTGVPNSTITWMLKRAGVERVHVRRPPVPSEITEAIRVKWLDGDSQSKIAKSLGITTSAVAGIVHRRGFTRSPEITAANLKRAAAERASKPKPAPKPKLVAVASSDDTRVLMVPEAEAEKFAAREAAPQIMTAGEDPVMKLRALDCRWPIGEPGTAGFRFCGCVATVAFKKDGAPLYCSEHGAKAFRKPSKADKEAVYSIGRWAA